MTSPVPGGALPSLTQLGQVRTREIVLGSVTASTTALDTVKTQEVS